jgi:hypothetical protein
VPGADPKTFELIDKYIIEPGSVSTIAPTLYAKDKGHLYEGPNIIIGADPRTTILYCHDVGEVVSALQLACQIRQ